MRIRATLVLVCCILGAMLLGTEAYAQCSSSNAIFSKNPKGCAPHRDTFWVSGLSPGTTVYWDIGHGSYFPGKDTAFGQYSAPGSYTVYAAIGSGPSACTLSMVVEVLATPTPTFTVSPGIALCGSNQSITVTDNTPDIISREWLIDGDYYPNAAATVNKFFGSPGNKLVSLIATDKYGCVSTKSVTVVVTDTVPVDICGDVYFNATNIRARFRPFVQPGNLTAQSYDWQFPGGSPSSFSGANPPDVIYSDVNAKYTVSLTITMQGGCKYTARYVNLVENYIRPSTFTPCIGKEFTIDIINSGNYPRNWQFNTPGLMIDPEKSTTSKLVAFTTQVGKVSFFGNFHRGEQGCRISAIYNDIFTSKGPRAEFDATPRAVCTPDDSFTLRNNSSTTGLTDVVYIWYIHDEEDKLISGQVYGPYTTPKDVVIGFDKPASFGVSLVAYSPTSGCRDSVFKSKYLTIAVPKVDFKADTLRQCMGGQISLTNIIEPDNPNNNYDFTWVLQHAEVSNVKFTFQSQKNIIFRPNYPGEYHVTLIVKFNDKCSDTVTKAKYLHISGVVHTVFVDPVIGCVTLKSLAEANLTYTFPKPPNNNLKLEWKTEPEDGALIEQPNLAKTFIWFYKTGCYDVSLSITDKEGCISRVSRKTQVCAGVPPKFDMSKASCPGDTIRISNVQPSAISDILWEVVPPNAATIIGSPTSFNPQFVIKTRDNFQLRVITKATVNNQTCGDTVLTSVKLDKPDAAFTTSDSFFRCAPAAVVFNAVPGMAKYMWDFGDGTKMVSDTNVTAHLFEKNSNDGFTVSLIVMNDAGCSDTFVRKNFLKIIGPEPSFTLSPKTACGSTTATIVNTSRNVPLGYSFLHGDGNNSSNFDTISHFYQLPFGMDSFWFVPSIFAIDNSACRSAFEDTLKLYRAMPFDYEQTVAGGCVPFQVTFQNHTQLLDSIGWDLNGDGEIDTIAQTASYIYDQQGMYDVMAILYRKGGCIDTIIIAEAVEARPSPVARVNTTALKGCGRLDVDFSDLSLHHDWFIMDYGDGLPPDSNVIGTRTYLYNPSAAAPDSTVFTYKFVAHNMYDCSDTVSEEIVVYAPVIPSFVAFDTVGCEPLTVQFVNTSLYSTTALWDIDNDGIYDYEGDTIVHVYGQGRYTVRMKALNIIGCADSAFGVNQILATAPVKAQPYTSHQKTCFGDTVTFAGASLPADDLDNEEWYLYGPDGSMVAYHNGNTFMHRFEESGHFSYAYVAHSRYGCKDSVYRSRAIYIEDTLQVETTPLWYTTVNEDSTVSIFWHGHKLDDFAHWHLEGFDGTDVYIVRDNVRQYRSVAAKSLSSSMSLCYSLTTFDSCGNEPSEASVLCTVWLTASAEDFSIIDLAWTEYHGWKSSTYYVILRGEDPAALLPIDTQWSFAGVYADKGLCNTPYYYRIAAVDMETGETSYSNIVREEPNYEYQVEPLLVRYVTTLGDDSLKWAWEPGKQPNVRRYQMEWEVAGSGQKDTAWVNHPATDFILNKHLAGISVHSIRVRVQDACGNLSPWSEVSHNIVLSAARAKNNDAILIWSPYSYWPQGIARYRLSVVERDKTLRDRSLLPSNTTSFVDDEVYDEIDTAYCYRVTAYQFGLSGDSSNSNIACAPLSSALYIPNAFSPNGDSINDTWQVRFFYMYNRVEAPRLQGEIQIFDRWGSLVWETDDLQKHWDGKAKNKNAPEGVYYYRIDAKGIDGVPFRRSGTITLLR